MKEDNMIPVLQRAEVRLEASVEVDNKADDKVRFVTGYQCASPLGDVVLRGDASHLTGLWFAGQKHFPLSMPVLSLAQATREGQVPAAVRQAADELADYFAGKLTCFGTPVRLSGTAFQQRVWQLLLDIPYGVSQSYGYLARQAGLPAGGARAIGNAVGRNPVSLIVPCHRVVGSSGALTGYAGGVHRKEHLLRLEAARDAADRPFGLVSETM